MLATKIKKNTDSVIWFSADHKSGVMIQPKFRRATFFVDNITKDNFDYSEDTAASEVDQWILSKRNLFEQEKASIQLEPEEA